MDTHRASEYFFDRRGDERHGGGLFRAEVVAVDVRGVVHVFDDDRVEPGFFELLGFADGCINKLIHRQFGSRGPRRGADVDHADQNVAMCEEIAAAACRSRVSHIG